MDTQMIGEAVDIDKYLMIIRSAQVKMDSERLLQRVRQEDKCKAPLGTHQALVALHEYAMSTYRQALGLERVLPDITTLIETMESIQQEIDKLFPKEKQTTCWV